MNSNHWIEHEKNIDNNKPSVYKYIVKNSTYNLEDEDYNNINNDIIKNYNPKKGDHIYYYNNDQIVKSYIIDESNKSLEAIELKLVNRTQKKGGKKKGKKTMRRKKKALKKKTLKRKHKSKK